MKQNDLILVLKKYLNQEVRKIIREEIKYSIDKDVRTIVREELDYLNSSKIHIHEDDIIDPPKKEFYHSLVPKKRNKTLDGVKFSDNPLLNSILLETAKEYSSVESKGMDEWKTMGNIRTSDQAQSSSSPQIRTLPLQQTENNKGVVNAMEMIPPDRRGRDIPDFLKDVLERNYSSLTKEMSKPKTGPSAPLPGMMPPV